MRYLFVEKLIVFKEKLNKINIFLVIKRWFPLFFEGSFLFFSFLFFSKLFFSFFFFFFFFSFYLPFFCKVCDKK